jgi:hypothetical protein
MRRPELEHVVGAAANIANEDDFIVIGSQAILGQYPEAPDQLLRSMEADLYPAKDPKKASDIDWALGDGSPFHQAFGYYAHGVGPQTAKPPAGWEDRLVEIVVPRRPGSPRSPRAYCLEAHDTVLAKCVANRERDWEFAEDAIRAGVVQAAVLLSRVEDLPVDAEVRAEIRLRLERIASAANLA